MKRTKRKPKNKLINKLKHTERPYIPNKDSKAMSILYCRNLCFPYPNWEKPINIQENKGRKVKKVKEVLKY